MKNLSDKDKSSEIVTPLLGRGAGGEFVLELLTYQTEPAKEFMKTFPARPL